MNIDLLKRNLIFYILVSITFPCCWGIGDPVAYADYFVTNNTTTILIVTAFGNFGIGEVELLANEINPAAKKQIYTFVEGSGGHVMPSNAWDEFYVYAEHESDSTIIYSGIENSDWKPVGFSSDGHVLYNLTIE
jgi:hypothetical protein